MCVRVCLECLLRIRMRRCEPISNIAPRGVVAWCSITEVGARLIGLDNDGRRICYILLYRCVNIYIVSIVARRGIVCAICFYCAPRDVYVCLHLIMRTDNGYSGFRCYDGL